MSSMVLWVLMMLSSLASLAAAWGTRLTREEEEVRGLFLEGDADETAAPPSGAAAAPRGLDRRPRPSSFVGFDLIPTATTVIGVREEGGRRSGLEGKTEEETPNDR
jgi:hypothetical protein